MEQRQATRQEAQAQDKFMGKLYQLVSNHRDSQAVLLLMTKYGLDTPTHELEVLFNRVEEWGASRPLLCLGRLIIHILDNEGRHGKAIVIIEKCQKISPQFILPDVSRILFFAEMGVN